MSPELAIIIALACFVALTLAKVPVAFGLLLAGTCGLVLQEGTQRAGAVLASQPFQSVFNYSLLVVPLFIALGVYVREAGVAPAIYRVLSRVLRRVPGGLAVATVLAGAGFAAVSGSSTATAATLGKLSITEMLAHGYSKQNAGAVVAAAGTLGILIPPSIALVLYGMITGESIGDLLLAGIIPGVLSVIALATTAVIVDVRYRKGLSEPAELALAKTSASNESAAACLPASTLEFAGQEIAPAVNDSGPVGDSQVAESNTAFELNGIVATTVIIVLFGVVVGGIYTGLMTTTESAAVGALLALVFLIGTIIVHDPKGLPTRLASSVRETVTMSSMIFAIFIGAGLFNYLLVAGMIPSRVTEFAAGLDVPPELIVIMFLLILIPLGMFLDGTAMMLIVAPLAHPVVTELGFSGLWFAILFVILVEVGLLTPPVGLNAYVVAGASGEVTVTNVFRGLVPYLAAEVAVVVTLFLVPGLVTWLPLARG